MYLYELHIAFVQHTSQVTPKFLILLIFSVPCAELSQTSWLNFALKSMNGKQIVIHLFSFVFVYCHILWFHALSWKMQAVIWRCTLFSCKNNFICKYKIDFVQIFCTCRMYFVQIFVSKWQRCMQKVLLCFECLCVRRDSELRRGLFLPSLDAGKTRPI